MHLPRGSRQALRLLLEVSEFARATSESQWTFAIGIGEFRRGGVAQRHLRWLIAKGYIEHAHEKAVLGGEFQTCPNRGRQRFAEDSCFVITPTGSRFAKEIAVSGSAQLGASVIHALDDSLIWDADRRELWHWGLVVKTYRRPAPLQEIILSCFQEDGWPAHIDDPLSGAGSADPQQRIRSII